MINIYTIIHHNFSLVHVLNFIKIGQGYAKKSDLFCIFSPLYLTILIAQNSIKNNAGRNFWHKHPRGG